MKVPWHHPGAKVTEQLHDGAAVGFDGGAHGLVVPIHQVADGLRVETFVERRRPDQVSEDDRDDFTGSGFGGAGSPEPRQGHAAPAAELLAGLVRRAARRARHVQARTALGAEAAPGTIAVTARRTGDSRLRFHDWPAWVTTGVVVRRRAVCQRLRVPDRNPSMSRATSCGCSS
jgi:hypothetical protein